MTTARDIVKRAMQKIGALIKSEDPTADEAVDGMAALNDLIESWSNETGLIPSRVTESFTLTGAQTYTVGIGGDFNTTPPTQIISLYARNGDLDYPIDSVTDEQYANIGYKNIQSTPEFYNYTYAYPLGTLKFYPIINSGYQLFMVSEKPISSFSSLDADVSMPPGWDRALVYNLAVEMVPEYGQQVDQSVYALALESKGMIMRKTNKNRSISICPDQVGSNSILSGWWS